MNSKFKKSKLTPWFPSHLCPCREGLYELRYKGKKEILAGEYENSAWNLCCGNDNSPWLPSSSDWEWRGLSSPIDVPSTPIASPPRRYRGKLYFDEVDHLDISAFIVRDDQIGFSLASVTRVHGRWAAESGVPALKQPNGTYRAYNVMASKIGVVAANKWDVVFCVDYEAPFAFIEVSGELLEGISRYSFEGELEAFS